jgi:hypothetical protein
MNFGNILKSLFRPELIIPAVATYAFGPQVGAMAETAVGFMAPPTDKEDKPIPGGYFGQGKEAMHTGSYYGAITSKKVGSAPQAQVQAIRNLLQLGKYDNNRRMQLALLNSVQNNQFWKAVSMRNKIDLGHDVYAKSTATAASAPNIKLES